MGKSILGRPSPYSSGVDVSELERLGSRHNRPAGQILIEDDENTDHALYLVKGYAKILIGSRKRIVAIRPQGSFVGEMAAIDGEKRSARVVALTDVEAILIPGPKFVRYLTDHPTILLGVLRETNRRFLETSRRNASSDLSSEIRIAQVIVELLDLGLGKETRDGLELGFNQRDLGQLAGMSRESAAKAVSAYKQQGLVDVARGSVTIHDIARLRELGESETVE